ncbi:MAG: hypothetical protein BGO49_28580 [Planctomycetales bacterium 71-10]|nr:MAG: hypothetical protein BGO49_28580 [Planctomycetales bacterium 71-10]
MLSTAFRIVLLDISSSVRSLLAVCEVTLDGEGRPVAWKPGDICFRGETSDDLKAMYRALLAAFDSEILVESELDRQGVRYVV